MILVTGLTALAAVLFSWKVETRPNEFFFWLLLVVGGSYGVFMSADLFLFFVFLLLRYAVSFVSRACIRDL
jgi:NADH-quinone oxidoreductase subunit M